MNAKICAKLVVVVMLVATVALQASATVGPASIWCEAKCWTLCAPARDQRECIRDCLRKCDDKVETTTQGQCSLGCLMSKCFEPHPDAKAAKACVNSCEQGCKLS